MMTTDEIPYCSCPHEQRWQATTRRSASEVLPGATRLRGEPLGAAREARAVRYLLAAWCALLLPFALGAAPVDPRAPRNSDGKVFLHPGISYTQGDLDRMKAMVEAGKEPWKKCYDALAHSRWASPLCRACPRGPGLGSFNNTIGFDGRHAHDQALMYRLTGDADYARRARDLINTCAGYREVWASGTPALDNGKIFLMVEAAELIRDFPEWAEADKEKFRKVLRDVFYPVIKNGDTNRWGNQGLSAYKGSLAIAIFLDDEKMYDRVWNYLTDRRHRPDDEPGPAGGAHAAWWPSVKSDCMVTFTGRRWFDNNPDWGYDEVLKYYIYKNGQVQESCRDQAHTTYGLFNFVAIADMFWSQGDDLYGELDNRILTGCEWTLRYNKDKEWAPTGATNDESVVTFENGLYYTAMSRSHRWMALAPCAWGRGADGGPAAPRTAALMHYSIVKGLPEEKCHWLKWTVDKYLSDGGFESWGYGANWYYEFIGWGTLTKTRTKWMRGDPVTWVKGRRVSGAHKLPGVIRFTDWDYYPLDDHPRTHRQKHAGRWSDGDWTLYTVTSSEEREMKVRLVYTSYGTPEILVAGDTGKSATIKLPPAKEKHNAYVGKVKIPAGASVIRFAIKKSAPGFKPLGLRFE